MCLSNEDEPMTLMKFAMTSSACAAALALAGCSTNTTNYPEAAPASIEADGLASANDGKMPMMATASLKTADGKDVGTVTATAADGGINISISVMGMTAGDHGVHVHTVGKCDAPAFESAGGHWNPGGAQHGLSNPEGQHSGDMPSLTIATDGTGKQDYAIKDAAFDRLLDADGAAIVIHAKPDDQMTDPSGDSGKRIACGVLMKG